MRFEIYPIKVDRATLVGWRIIQDGRTIAESSAHFVGVSGALKSVRAVVRWAASAEMIECDADGKRLREFDR